MVKLLLVLEKCEGKRQRKGPVRDEEHRESATEYAEMEGEPCPLLLLFTVIMYRSGSLSVIYTLRVSTNY